MENKRKISKWDPGRHRAWFRHLNYKRTDLQHLNLIVFHQRSWLFFLKHVFKCIYFSLHCFRWGCPRCVHAHPLGYCIFFSLFFFFFFTTKISNQKIQMFFVGYMQENINTQNIVWYLKQLSEIIGVKRNN